MVIVALPDAAVQESCERMQAAVKNSGLFYPRKRVTVNLAPASVRKEGPAYDLPIALGVLAAADRGQARHHQPRPVYADFPGQLYADCGDEPLPVQLTIF
jgi:predicted ATPase with chaperone activity